MLARRTPACAKPSLSVDAQRSFRVPGEAVRFVVWTQHRVPAEHARVTASAATVRGST
eukprot:SAG31_NODE_134_length_23213_cov_5.698624_5_plen_58_part_00